MSVQIRRTVRQPNDNCSSVLEQVAKLRGELLVAVQDEQSIAAQKAVERVGEIPTDLHHEPAVRPGSDSSNVHFSRRQLDDDEHIVGHEPADRGDLDGEEVGRSNGFPMGREKRAPRRPLTSLWCGLDAMFPHNIGDGASWLPYGRDSRGHREFVYTPTLDSTVAPHYRRAEDEGRALIRSALAAAGDIEVTDDELQVSLEPVSSPHRTKALAALCERLNETRARFPGSKLYLRFDVKPDPPASLAFPGPRRAKTAPVEAP